MNDEELQALVLQQLGAGWRSALVDDGSRRIFQGPGARMHLERQENGRFITVMWADGATPLEAYENLEKQITLACAEVVTERDDARVKLATREQQLREQLARNGRVDDERVQAETKLETLGNAVENYLDCVDRYSGTEAAQQSRERMRDAMYKASK